MMDDDDDRLAAAPDPEGAPSDRVRTADPAGSDAPTTDRPAARTASPGVDLQAYIGRQLRAVYDDVAQQPVPERFLDLMRQLEEQTAGKTG